MDSKLEDKLFKKYPTIFPKGRKVDSRNSLMCFGISCGHGWYKLIDKLCSDIVKMKGGKKVVAVQVKEKFGGLRFYVVCATEEIFKRITQAEDDSFTICEYCGKYGELRTIGWYRTLCDKCWAKRKKDLEIVEMPCPRCGDLYGEPIGTKKIYGICPSCHFKEQEKITYKIKQFFRRLFHAEDL